MKNSQPVKLLNTNGVHFQCSKSIFIFHPTGPSVMNFLPTSRLSFLFLGQRQNNNIRHIIIIKCVCIHVPNIRTHPKKKMRKRERERENNEIKTKNHTTLGKNKFKGGKSGAEICIIMWLNGRFTRAVREPHYRWFSQLLQVKLGESRLTPRNASFPWAQ